MEQSNLPQNVIEWLLSGQFQNPLVSYFVDVYLKRLDAAAKEKVTISDDGVVVLQRWESPEGGSYGYNPVEIAFCLRKLNMFFSEVTHSPNIRGLRLSQEILVGFAGVLGYTNICRFCLDTHSHFNTIGKQWFMKLCDVFQEFPEIEIYRYEQDTYPHLLIPLDLFPRHSRGHPHDALYWCDRDASGDYEGYRKYVNDVIAPAEVRRLVGFVKSLRMLCSTLAPKDEPEGRDDPGLQTSGARVAVKEVTEKNGTYYYRIQLSDDTRFSGSRSFIIGVPKEGEIELSEDDNDG